MCKVRIKKRMENSIMVGGTLLQRWSDGRLELQSSLEGLSGNCQMTNTIQNLFNGMYIIFFIKEGCWLWSGP